MKLIKVMCKKSDANVEKSVSLLLNPVKEKIAGIINSYVKAVQSGSVFPYVDFEQLEWKVSDECSEYELFYESSDSKLSSSATEWLEKFASKTNKYVLLDEETASQKKDIDKNYTFHEDGDWEFIYKKSELHDDNRKPLFNKSTGKIANPKQYEYVGEGKAKNLKTGKTFDATK